MMMNRERIGFWVRVFSIVLAAVFLISFLFLGVGTNLNINIFQLFGNQDQQQKQADQAPDPGEQIAAAEKDLKKDPKDPEKIKDLAALSADAIEYYNGYLDLQPKGEDAKKVKDRISALLEGGDSSGSSEP